jgi:hypothetical protein
LAAEVKPYNIRVTVAIVSTMNTAFNKPPVQPGVFADYDVGRAGVARYIDAMASRPASTKGDPHKAMEVIVDVVRGEGCAAGREDWPLWLPLGEEAVADIRSRLEKMAKTVDEWEHVAKGLNHEA